MHADPDAALDRIVERYREVAEQCDAVVIVGTDYTDVGTPTEFSYNARIAANLGAPVLLVLNGLGPHPRRARAAADMAVGRARGQPRARCSPSSPTGSTRRPPSDVGGARRRDDVPAYALPEEPLLTAPTVADLMAACDGTPAQRRRALLAREVTGLVVAAMTMPNVLDRLFDGARRRHPRRPARGRARRADRARVGELPADRRRSCSTAASSCPPRSTRLIDGLGATLPIIATDARHPATSTALTAVRGRLDEGLAAQDRRPRWRLFAEHVDGEALLDRLEVARTDGR